MVTANTSSLPEVAGDAALLADPNDAVPLVDTMHRVLTDPDLREELRQGGLRRVSAFKWQETAKQMSRLLDEVLRAS